MQAWQLKDPRFKSCQIFGEQFHRTWTNYSVLLQFYPRRKHCVNCCFKKSKNWIKIELWLDRLRSSSVVSVGAMGAIMPQFWGKRLYLSKWREKYLGKLKVSLKLTTHNFKATSMYFCTTCNCTMCNLLLLGKLHTR